MTPFYIGLAIFVAGALSAMVATRKNRPVAAPVQVRFPPISDEEFLARCTPGTRPEVALKVRRIVADHLAVEYERIHPSMNFIEDIGAD